jgi:amidase
LVNWSKPWRVARSALFAGRTPTIDGAQVPYFSQLAWPGIATYRGLPATCVPVGRTGDGLPVGVQIIGPYWEDRMTIALAGLIEQQLGQDTS